jgi:hypothetical protein
MKVTVRCKLCDKLFETSAGSLEDEDKLCIDCYLRAEDLSKLVKAIDIRVKEMGRGK